MDMKSWITMSRFDVGTPHRHAEAFHRSWQPALAALGVDAAALDDDETIGGSGDNTGDAE
jgi:hypothetical protein